MPEFSEFTTTYCTTRIAQSIGNSNFSTASDNPTITCDSINHYSDGSPRHRASTAFVQHMQPGCSSANTIALRNRSSTAIVDHMQPECSSANTTAHRNRSTTAIVQHMQPGCSSANTTALPFFFRNDNSKTFFGHSFAGRTNLASQPWHSIGAKPKRSYSTKLWDCKETHLPEKPRQFIGYYNGDDLYINVK